MSALKEAFDLIVGFPKHNHMPPSTPDYEVERQISDYSSFHLAVEYLGKLKQLKTYQREIWGYWCTEANGKDIFCVVVTKRKIVPDSEAA